MSLLHRAPIILLLVFGLVRLQAQEITDFGVLEEEASKQPERLLIFLNTSNDLPGISLNEISYLKAFCYEELGLYPKVDSTIQAAFEQFDFTEDSSIFLKYHFVLADQRKITDRFDEASDLLHKAIEIAENLSDTLNLANAYISLGELYRATEYFEIGLRNLERAEDLLEQSTLEGKNRLLARLYGRRSAIFLQSNIHLDSVEVLSFKSLFIGREIGDVDLQATSLNELGHLYSNAGKDKAESYLKEAINLWEVSGYAAYSSNARLNLSRYYQVRQQYHKGINVLLENLELVEDSPWRWFRGEYYDMLGQLYAGMDNYKLAYKYANKAKDTLIVVNEIQYNKQLALFATQLEVQKKEDELYRQTSEAEKARLEAATKTDENRVLFYMVISLISIAVITLFFLYFINKQKNRLQEQKKQIEIINGKFADLVDQKQALLREVNHRVKNNLSVLSSLLYLQQKKLQNEEAIKALKDSQIRINTISLIHESLYNRDDMDRVNFQDYLVKLTNYIKGIYWQKEQDVDIHINCKKFTPDLTNSLPLAMIINELITNSFKYAFKEVDKPQISIINLNGNILYSDNGPGITEKKENSLGLKLLEVFAKQIGASIKADKTDTAFQYTINLTDEN